MSDRRDVSWCVHCLGLLAQIEIDMDHVITEGFGGRQYRVQTCKRCNSSLGSQLEGKLLSRGPFQLLARAHGFTSGTSRLDERDGGAGTDVDYLTGEFRPRGQTLEETEHDSDGNPVRMRVTAAADMREHVIRRLNKQFGDGGSWAHSSEPLPHVVNLGSFLIQIDVREVRRLSAKTALTAGAFLWGDKFIRTRLADVLRVLLDVRRDWPGGVPGQHPHAGARYHDIQPVEDRFFREVSDQVRLIGHMPLVGASARLLSPAPAVKFMKITVGTQVNLSALGLDFPPLSIAEPLPSNDGYGVYPF